MGTCAMRESPPTITVLQVGGLPRHAVEWENFIPAASGLFLLPEHARIAGGFNLSSVCKQRWERPTVIDVSTIIFKKFKRKNTGLKDSNREKISISKMRKDVGRLEPTQDTGLPTWCLVCL